MNRFILDCIAIELHQKEQNRAEVKPEIEAAEAERRGGSDDAKEEVADGSDHRNRDSGWRRPCRYPDQRINVIVPFVAGGATDIIARTIAADLASRFGQTVTIENRAGGGTAVGTEAVVRSSPDGYTILFNSGALTIDAGFNKKLTYDVRKDLMPVTKAAWGPYAVLVYKEIPVKTLGELVGYAKEKPSTLNMGSAGVGTMGHLASAYLAAKTDIKLIHVPFRGSAPALTAVMGGHVQVLLDPPFTAMPAIELGSTRALAVTGARRSPLLPNVPTVAELGFPGFAAGHWGGFFSSPPAHRRP